MALEALTSAVTGDSGSENSGASWGVCGCKMVGNQNLLMVIIAAWYSRVA